ncbi:MAG: bifunctional glutamate N-acetyltransferase/amino-acid acetyltransferase ArgJ, partial [Eggerthellaceae bacterium]|nr:bifunctional glutamate N-acetyltransferase/amino-acid acetyltransferase ArgJ [Eggerthellaceae bacterium]
EKERLDMALVVAEEPAQAAAVFTKNTFCAAPVRVSRAHLSKTGAPGEGWGIARAIVINSGNANACTGEPGLANAESSAKTVAEAIGCPEDEVLVASTGLIGVQLDTGPFSEGVPKAISELSPEGGELAARAMMTSDNHPKQCAVSFSGDGIGYPGCTFTVGGMVKGAGMIMPNMATMIAVITTDAPVMGPDLHYALTRAANESFNRISVDSDTSTNDTAFLLSSGKAAQGMPSFTADSPAFEMFEHALASVCENLARQIAMDGEGSTRLITVNVRGAKTDEQAQVAARAVANSPLVKTAVFGHDANWGRIAAALGKSGAQFDAGEVDIDIMGIPVCKKGLTVPFDEDEALARFESREIVIDVDLGAGEGSCTIWGCDLTYEYVRINGEYRS